MLDGAVFGRWWDISRSIKTSSLAGLSRGAPVTQLGLEVQHLAVVLLLKLVQSGFHRLKLLRHALEVLRLLFDSVHRA